jgi:hypothetical protein
VLSSALNRDTVIEQVQWANPPPKFADGAAGSLHFRNRQGSSDNHLSLLGCSPPSRRHRRGHCRIEIGSRLCQPSSRRRTVHRILLGSRRAPMSPASQGCSQGEPNPTKALPFNLCTVRGRAYPLGPEVTGVGPGWSGTGVRGRVGTNPSS